MNSGKWLIATAAVLLTGSVLIAADEASAPATQPSAEVAKKGKLTKPWSQLTGLTDEQKEKIETIHGDANVQRKEIDAKEKSDIEALLTDDQKAELKTLTEKPKSKKKTPSTEPAQ